MKDCNIPKLIYRWGLYVCICSGFVVITVSLGSGRSILISGILAVVSFIAMFAILEFSFSIFGRPDTIAGPTTKAVKGLHIDVELAEQVDVVTDSESLTLFDNSKGAKSVAGQLEPSLAAGLPDSGKRTQLKQQMGLGK